MAQDPGGAWGLGLFQSDFDYDKIQDLGDEAGILWRLERDDAKQNSEWQDTVIESCEPPTFANGATDKKAIYCDVVDKALTGKASTQSVRNIEHDRADECKVKRKDDELYYSLYAKLCSHPDRVRQYLDDNLILLGMMAKHRKKAEQNKDDPKRPTYVCVLLGACAMSLGCKIPEGYLSYLRAVYAHRKRVGLMRDALTQMSKALFGPDGYKNDGTPYDFGNKGLQSTIASGGPPLEDRYLPIPEWINVPSPAGILADAMITQAMLMGHFESYHKTLDSLHEKLEAAKGGVVDEYGKEVCGGCGGKEGEGGKALVTCSRCKDRLYCGKACQAKDWPEHKKDCMPPPAKVIEGDEAW